MATYKTGWLRLPSDPKDFKERFAWSHVKSIFYDKAKNILLKKKLDDMDGLIADHADAIANKLMTNDAFNTAIADYVTKAMMSSTQVNDANHVPTSSLAYAMQQAITANANAITQLNSDLDSSGLMSADRINLKAATVNSLYATDRVGVFYVTGSKVDGIPSGFSNYGLLLNLRSPYSTHPTDANSVRAQIYIDVNNKRATRTSNNGKWTDWSSF